MLGSSSCTPYAPQGLKGVDDDDDDEIGLSQSPFGKMTDSQG